MGNIHLANEMAETLRSDGIISVSLRKFPLAQILARAHYVDPGNIKTELARHSGSIAQIFVSSPLTMGPQLTYNLV
jgi:hypothetical protein